MPAIPHRTVRNPHRSQVSPVLRQALDTGTSSNMGVWLGTSAAATAGVVVNTSTAIQSLDYSAGWLTPVYWAGSDVGFDQAAAQAAPTFLPQAGVWRCSVECSFADAGLAAGRRLLDLRDPTGATVYGTFFDVNLPVGASNNVMSGATVVRLDGVTRVQIRGLYTGPAGPIGIRLRSTAWQQLASIRAKPI